MCKELNEEIERGDKAINLLAKHLLNMGSANMEKTVVIDGVIIKVTATAVARI
jgi:hypothetical protein